MKKTFALMLASLMILTLLAGCEAGMPSNTASSGESSNSPASSVELSDNSPASSDEPSENEPTPSDAGNELGTRSNPYPLNVTATYDGMDITKSYLSYFAFTAELTATEVIRGDEASAMFSNDPEEDKEFFLVKFKVKVLDSVFDEVINMNNARFDIVSKNGVKYGDLVSATGIKTLDDIYTGGETEGFIYCIIDVGDEPTIVFAESQNGGIWFTPTE